MKSRAAAFGALAATLAGCGKLQDFGGLAAPLASFQVTFSGDLTPLLPAGVNDVHALRLALVWGAQWLTEPFCVLGPEPGTNAAAVIAAGCRDPFSFVPLEVGASVPLASAGPTSLVLDALPSADVLVGDITSRVAYGSFVVFDDRADHGTLDLATPQRTASGRGDRQGGGNTVDPARIIYGASFWTMMAPDRRVAYREGAPPTGAFYPRQGCDPPAPGFSVVDAGGFPADAKASALMGQLPKENPSTCHASAPEATTIDIAAQAPAVVEEVGCDERVQDGSTRYREPPATSPDLTNRQWACAHLPTFDTGGGAMSTLIQLVVTGHPTDQCVGLTHYTLRGCRENVTCPVPDWDYTAAPPAWWPSTCR